MINYQALSYGPTYLVQGVPATLTLSTGARFEGLKALDKTAGIEVIEHGVSIGTLQPAADLRIPDLKALGVTVDMLPDATFEINGFSWNVDSYKLRPSPNGERDGEVMLLLSQKAELNSESESESESASI